MSEPRKVRCYASVDQPYRVVRASLHRLPFASVAGSPALVCTISDEKCGAGLPPVTRVALDWEGEGAPAGPHLTSAEIYASPDSASKTQLEIEGHWCATPNAPAGDNDSAQAAEACMQVLLEGLLESLRRRPGTPREWGPNQPPPSA